MDVLIMVGQLLLGLMILVGVHEAGHMMAAKFFGMRVEKFSIGFPPKILGFKIGETVYSLGALPLGGFVKISGMVDESMDTKNLDKAPEPWEFRAKPAWQRLIVMLGGIIMNVITGIVIFTIMTYTFGKTTIPKEAMKYGIHAFPLAESIGLQSGDKIVGINGHDYESFDELVNPDFLLGDKMAYTVERNGETFEVKVPGYVIDSISSQVPFISFAFTFKVGQVVPESNAAKGGLKDNDKIVAVNDKPINFFHDIQEALGSIPGKEAVVVVNRDSTELDTLSILVSEDGKIGFMPESTMDIEMDTVHYSLTKSASIGTGQAFNVLYIQFKAIKKMFTGEISARKSLSGPVGMATQFGGEFIAFRFWYLVGLLSMVLAFMNLLPIPALDGGHVMFLLYEMITGKKPADKFMEKAVKIGIAILLSLMIFAFGNDILRLLDK